VQVTTPGSPSKRYFKSYDLDEVTAVQLVRRHPDSETCQAVTVLTADEFTAAGIKPGDVKLHG
jgi:hypothetical protein